MVPVPYLIQLPADGLGKAAEDGPSIRATAMHVGNPDDVVIESWLLPGPTLTIAVTKGMNQTMEDLSLSLSLSPSRFLSPFVCVCVCVPSSLTLLFK